MASSTLFVGQRVQSKLGPATIIGFEHFDDGKTSLIVDTETAHRIQVRLDTPENWLLHETGGNPFMWRSDLGELNET